MSRGGMRYGSGRPSYKLKAEHLLRVEVGRWYETAICTPGGHSPGAGTLAMNLRATSGYLCMVLTH